MNRSVEDPSKGEGGRVAGGGVGEGIPVMKNSQKSGWREARVSTISYVAEGKGDGKGGETEQPNIVNVVVEVSIPPTSLPEVTLLSRKEIDEQLEMEMKEWENVMKEEEESMEKMTVSASWSPSSPVSSAALSSWTSSHVSSSSPSALVSASLSPASATSISTSSLPSSHLSSPSASTPTPSVSSSTPSEISLPSASPNPPPPTKNTSSAKLKRELDLDPTTLFELGLKIGKGQFATVYRARRKPQTSSSSSPSISSTNGTLEKEVEGEEVAIKKLDLTFLKKSKETMSALNRELRIHKNLASIYVVGFHGSFLHRLLKEEEQLWICLEFCDVCLGQVLQTRKKPLKEETIKAISTQVMRGLAYLHSNGIVHMDIKSDNILLTKMGGAKIADFGISYRKAGVGGGGEDDNCSLSSSSSSSSVMQGTPYWMSPELILQEDYDEKVDIWAIGITVIEMVDLKPPYYDLLPFAAIVRIADENSPKPNISEAKKQSCSRDLIDFIDSCCVKSPEGRPTSSFMLGHPFILIETLDERGRPREPSHLDPLVPSLCFPIMELVVEAELYAQKHKKLSAFEEDEVEEEEEIPEEDTSPLPRASWVAVSKNGKPGNRPPSAHCLDASSQRALSRSSPPSVFHSHRKKALPPAPPRNMDQHLPHLEPKPPRLLESEEIGRGSTGRPPSLFPPLPPLPAGFAPSDSDSTSPPTSPSSSWRPSSPPASPSPSYSSAPSPDSPLSSSSSTPTYSSAPCPSTSSSLPPSYTPSSSSSQRASVAPFLAREHDINGIDELVALMRNEKKGVSIKKRYSLLKSYDKCFVGNEAVDWILRNLGMSERAEARLIGQTLLQRGIIFSLTAPSWRGFMDSRHYYRFKEDQMVARERERASIARSVRMEGFTFKR